MKKITASLLLATCVFGFETSFLDPFYESKKSDWFSVAVAKRDHKTTKSISYTPTKELSIFLEDRDDSSLAGVEYLLREDDGVFPKLSFVYRYGDNVKSYLLASKRVKYFGFDVGYEKKERDFFGGVRFYYSPSVTLYYQKTTQKKDNFWLKYKKDIFSISVGSIDEKLMLLFGIDLDASKNYHTDSFSGDKLSVNRYGDEIEGLFSFEDRIESDYKGALYKRAHKQKDIEINYQEYKAYKEKRVSKSYIRDAIKVKRDYKDSANIGFLYDIYLDVNFNRYLHKNTTSKSFNQVLLGADVGKLDFYLNLSYDLNSSKVSNLTLNYTTNLSQNFFFKLEAGRVDEKNRYSSFEVLKTFDSEKLSLGLTYQKLQNKDAKYFDFIYLFDNNLLSRLRFGEFLNSKKAYSIEIKKVYKDFELGAYFLHESSGSKKIVGAYVSVPFAIKNFYINPRFNFTNRYNDYYIDTKNSLSDDLFSRGNVKVIKNLF